FHRADQRERRAGAAAGVLDDTHAWTQRATAFGAFYHRQRHTVLVGTGRVVGLQLDNDVRATGVDDAAKPDYGCVADCGKDGVANVGHELLNTDFFLDVRV